MGLDGVSSECRCSVFYCCLIILTVTWLFAGSFNGSLSTLAAHDLGAVAIREVLDRAKVKAAQVSEVIMGHVLTAGEIKIVCEDFSDCAQLLIFLDRNMHQLVFHSLHMIQVDFRTW